MKLKKVQICNFRSIVEVDEIELEERLTVLIGKNEQGKTTFLRALASFDPSYRYAPSDLPNHLSALLEERPKSEIPMVTLWLAATPEDQDRLKTILPNFNTVHTFKISKYFDGHYQYHGIFADGNEAPLEFPAPNISDEVARMHQSLDALGEKLNAHASRLPAFAQHLPTAISHLDAFKQADVSDPGQLDNLVSTLSTALTAVPGQDPSIQKDITAFSKEIRSKTNTLKSLLSQDVIEQFHEVLPKFVFHSTSLDKIPNEVSLADFINDPNRTSQGMANLCAAAGLTMQRISELATTADTNRRHVFEDHYKSYISGGINEFWTQERYAVHFQFERDKLTVSISDDTYKWRIPPADRSDGFQWYLSFYSALLTTVSGPRPTVLLLDNPGLELHADGQRDIKKFLEEKLPWNTQIIYVTHSPAMIDPYRLEQVREVELLGKEQGTKVRRLRLQAGANSDLLEPVRSAIGASLINSLMFSELNVLVEGAADKPILEGAFACANPDLAKKTMINGSIAESNEWLPEFYERTKLPYVVYLDADSSGRNLASTLKAAKIPEQRILLLSNIFERQGDFELEDIFTEEFYRQAVVETYPEQQIPNVPEGEGKRTKKYERIFKESMGFDFSKRRVAVTLKRLLIEGKADEQSRIAASRLIEKLQSALQLTCPH